MQKDFDEVKSIIDDNIEDLLEQFNIVLIYIFGSYAKGTNTANSDLDIGILLEGDTYPMLRLHILNEFVGILGRDDIDLVILNDVDEVMKFQVIKYGKLAYYKNITEKVMFESRTMSEYMDKEHFRKLRNYVISKKFDEVFNNKE